MCETASDRLLRLCAVEIDRLMNEHNMLVWSSWQWGSEEMPEYCHGRVDFDEIPPRVLMAEHLVDACLVPDATESDCVALLCCWLHEACHLHAGRQEGHGPKWQSAMQRLGFLRPRHASRLHWQMAPPLEQRLTDLARVLLKRRA